MFVLNFVAIDPIDVEAFHWKPHKRRVLLHKHQQHSFYLNSLILDLKILVEYLVSPFKKWLFSMGIENCWYFAGTGFLFFKTMFTILF